MTNKKIIIAAGLIGMMAIIVILLVHSYIAAPYNGVILHSLHGVHPVSLNNAGQIIGYSQTASGEKKVFLWSMEKDKQDLTKFIPKRYVFDIIAINDAGLIAIDILTHRRSHIFLLDNNGDFQDIGPLGNAMAINNAGQVVGTSPDMRAFLWTKEKGVQFLEPSLSSFNPTGDLWTKQNGMQILQKPESPHTFAMDINQHGSVVGYLETDSDSSHAFLWTKEQGMQLLGELDEGASVAWSINDKNQVVGISRKKNQTNHAFLWTKETGMQDLGTFDGDSSWAHAINNAGQVVGVIDMADNKSHAFLWTKENGMQNLGTLGWDHSRATAINDKGQIMGSVRNNPSWWMKAWTWVCDTVKIPDKYRISYSPYSSSETVLWTIPQEENKSN